MWKAIIGKSSERADNSTSRRKDEVDRPAARHRSESIVSSNASRKPPRGDDRDRGFNPNSTSYSSTSRTAYPGTAPPSVASSYATAPGNQVDQAFAPPGLVRNPSLADQVARPTNDRDDHRRESDRERAVDGRMRRSTSRERTRDDKERSRSRERKGKKRTKKERRENRETDRGLDRGMSRSGDSYTEAQGLDRAGDYTAQPSGSFNAQVGGSSFTQFPGQYDGGMPAFPPTPSPAATTMSSHVPDQFPGQFPLQATAPYRPPLAASEGGLGLAAEYYGDTGESVSQQPGVRPQPPSLIVGAEPHLQAASAISAPPIEPSATGSVGAAASFYSATDGYQSLPSSKPPKPSKQSKPENASKPSKVSEAAVVAGSAAVGYAGAGLASSANQGPTGSQSTSFYQQGSKIPTVSSVGYSPAVAIQGNNHHSSSAPVLPTLGAAAAGAAAGYMMGHHSSSQQSRPSNAPLTSGGVGGYQTSSTSQVPDSQTHAVHVSASTNGRPSRPGKQPSQTNVPLYAAGIAGTAAAVGAAYQPYHHSTGQNVFNGTYPAGLNAQRHRHRGPLSKIVDFLKDPDGVAQFEEYTEYIGVCKYCFPPGSSPREAPRKHHYRRRGTNDRYGSNTRVDKESRYWSSDGESRRKNGKSWLATGMAGYGLAKVGKSLFNQDDRIDGTYSVRSGRANHSNLSLNSRTSGLSPDRRSHVSRGATHRSSDTTLRRRSRSRDRVETGITSDGRVYKKDPHGGFFGGPATTTYETRRRRSRSRSWSRDRRNGMAGGALGAVVGSSIATSTVRHRSRSPKKEFVRTKRRDQDDDPSFGVKLGNNGSREGHTGRNSSSSTYIDHSRPHRNPSGGIFGGFFSSPPAKRRKSRERKQKGFFNFGNSSSSSSNSDLAFGTGFGAPRSERPSKSRRDDRRNANAALLGLSTVAAAAALATNGHSRPHHQNQRADLVAVKESRGHGKRSEREQKYRRSSLSSSSEDDAWEDASEDDDSSTVSSGLAYGGPGRKSQDSLISEASGTGKWGWRWGSKRSKKAPNYPLDIGASTIPLAAPAVLSLHDNVADAPLAGYDRGDGTASIVSSQPAMRHVYPTSTSDPSRFDISRQSSITSNQPLVTSRPSAIPLQQPQPIAPVSSTVYTSQPPYGHSYSAPTGPPVFSQVLPQARPTVFDSRQARIVESPERIMPGSFVSPEIGNESKEKPQRRRASSPTPRVPDDMTSTHGRKRSSTRHVGSAVRSEISKAETDREFHDRRRQREDDDDKRRNSLRREEKKRAEENRLRRQREEENGRREEKKRADENQLRRQREEEDGRREEKKRADEEQLRRRKEEEGTRRERARVQEDNLRSVQDRQRKTEHEASHRKQSGSRETEDLALIDVERERQSRKTGDKGHSKTRREEDIEREIQRLRREERELESSKPSGAWVAPVVMGAMGAAAAASVADGQKKRREDQVERRETSKNGNANNKSSEQRTPLPEEAGNEDRGVQKVRNIADRGSSSPRHEDYASYFTPTELLSKSGEQRLDFDVNGDSEVTYQENPHIITIEPTGRKGPSPTIDFMASQDRSDPNHLPFPWSVPRLNLIEPTPPHSIAGSTKGDLSPVLRPEDPTDADITEPRKPSTASKVTWGEPETVEYTVITPLESLGEFISSSDMPTDVKKEDPVSLPSANAERRNETSDTSEVFQRHVPGEFGDDLEFAATLAAGLQDTGFDPSIVINDPTYHRRESPPGSERPYQYRQPYAETVTDLGIDSPGTEGAPPQRGFIEGELPSTPLDEQILSRPEGAVDKPDFPLSRKHERETDEAAKHHGQDGPATTGDGSTTLPSTNEILRQTDRYSREPELPKPIASSSPNDFDDTAGMKRNQRERSETGNRKIIPTSSRPPSLLDVSGDEYFDVSATLPRPSKSKIERDARDREYAASIPLPEDEPEETAATTRATTDRDFDEGQFKAKNSRSKKPRQYFEISESPNRVRTKDDGPDVARDGYEEQDHSKSRPPPGEKSRDESDDTDTRAEISLAAEADESAKTRKHKRKSKKGSVRDESPVAESRSVTASMPGRDESQDSRKTKRRSKRESVGYDDGISAASAPATIDDHYESRSKNSKDKKGGLFGLFSSSKSYENVSEVGKAGHAPREATFDDFEEPKKKSKRKSKDRSSSGDVYNVYSGAAQSFGDLSQIGQPKEGDDETQSQKSRPKEEKRRSRKGSTIETGITTQDLPLKVHIPAYCPLEAFLVDRIKTC